MAQHHILKLYLGYAPLPLHCPYTVHMGTGAILPVYTLQFMWTQSLLYCPPVTRMTPVPCLGSSCILCMLILTGSQQRCDVTECHNSCLLGSPTDWWRWCVLYYSLYINSS